MAPFPTFNATISTHNTNANGIDDDEYDDSDIPSVPVSELRGHEEGPIHIVRFTGEHLAPISHQITIPPLAKFKPDLKIGYYL